MKVILFRARCWIDEVAYIGKEANEPEETELLGLDESSYVEYLPALTRDNKGDFLR